MGILASLGGPQGTPGTIGGAGTTQKIFQAPSSGLVVASVADYVLSLPGSNRLNGRVFRVRMSGNVYVHGTSPTWQLQLLGSVAGTSNTILCQSAAVSLTTDNSYNWTLDALLFGSTAPVTKGLAGGGGALVGQFTTNINGTVGAQATLTNNLASVTFGPVLSATGPGTTNEPIAFLKAAALFAVSDAANLAQLTEFVVYDDTDVSA